MLRLLHTNDLHGGLTPARAERLSELREAADLLLDGGDAVARPRGQGLADDPAIRALAALDCDAMVPGNHEFLLLPYGAAPSWLVCANLLDRKDPAALAPSRRFPTPYGRIGVVGVTTPWTKFSARPLRRIAAYEADFSSRFVVTSPFEAAEREVARLRPEVDTLIVLSHLGSRGDAKLAARVSGIDVLLGAHTHETIGPTRLGRVWYAQSGADALGVGRYDWDGRTLVGGVVPL